MARAVIVTGASRGIGKAVALELAARGYDLLLAARHVATLDAVASLIASAGVRVVTHAVDVTDAGAGIRVRDAAMTAFGSIWGLVNNAGMAESAPLAGTDDDLMQTHLDLNLLAPMRLMRAVVPSMAKDGGGRVVNICSTAALAGYPYVSAYAASKHALLGATRSLAREFATRGVTFNAVCPGYVRTDMFGLTLGNIAQRTGMTEVQAEEKLRKMSPQNRVFEPVEVARSVAYLLSDDAAGINGQAISIDGGEIEH